MADDPPDVFDHYRPRGDDAPVFRVVGVDADRATLLRLTDEDGNREPTGDLRHVDRDELDATFERAPNPDPRFGTADYLAGLLLLAGVALAVHPAGDQLSGSILALGGGYLLWRRN
jgi:hypothetical protein